MPDNVELGDSKPPWYESNLVWAPLAVGIGIILAVIAAMVKDVRWLLIFAWPFLALGVWGFCRGRFSTLIRRSVITSGSVLIAAGLVWLYVALPHPENPPGTPMPKNTPNKAAREPLPIDKNPKSEPQAAPVRSPRRKTEAHAGKTLTPTRDIDIGKIEQTQAPCSGGIAIGGGTANGGNCGPPEPTLTWNIGPTTSSHDVLVSLTVDRSWDLPGFIATCDRPGVTTDVGLPALGNSFRRIMTSSPDGKNKVAMMLLSALGAGVTVQWYIGPQDGGEPIKVLAVSKMPEDLYKQLR